LNTFNLFLITLIVIGIIFLIPHNNYGLGPSGSFSMLNLIGMSQHFMWKW